MSTQNGFFVGTAGAWEGSATEGRTKQRFPHPREPQPHSEAMDEDDEHRYTAK